MSDFNEEWESIKHTVEELKVIRLAFYESQLLVLSLIEKAKALTEDENLRFKFMHVILMEALGMVLASFEECNLEESQSLLKDVYEKNRRILNKEDRSDD